MKSNVERTAGFVESGCLPGLEIKKTSQRTTCENHKINANYPHNPLPIPRDSQTGVPVSSIHHSRLWVCHYLLIHDGQICENSAWDFHFWSGIEQHFQLSNEMIFHVLK